MSSPSDTDVDTPLPADVGRTAALPHDPDHATRTPTPTQVGDYTLEGLLGSGALGRSFRARKADSPESPALALKLVHAQLAETPHFKRRLLREVEAAEKLEHQHIGKFVGHGDDPDAGSFLCRELVDGDDLITAVRRDVLTPRRLCELFGQLLSALAEAHRNGVLHRNLKPSNVMVVREADGREVVKVVDFGNPLRVREQAEYMAPEQRSGLPIDGRADVYAVGVMLYELLAGEVPFRGATPEETLSMHQHESLLTPREKRPDATLPRELEAVCLKALAKDPGERHRSPREMSQALRAVVALLGMRSDEVLGSSAFAEPGDVLPPSLARMTIPGEQLRSRTKFWLGAGLVAAVCALVFLSDSEPGAERIDRPSANASRREMAHGVRLLEEGQALLHGGDPDGAITRLRDARSSLGETPEVLRALGEALVVHGTTREAHGEGVTLLTRYLELEPGARDRAFVESLVRSSPRPEAR
ncbi:MAG: serine/threonine-protein kinase [Polyangiales bacterium]